MIFLTLVMYSIKFKLRHKYVFIYNLKNVCNRINIVMFSSTNSYVTFSGNDILHQIGQIFWQYPYTNVTLYY